MRRRSHLMLLQHMLLMSPLLMKIVVIDGAQCYNGQAQHISVTNTSDASDLADTLSCSSSAQLVIDWYGQIEITRTLVIRNSSDVGIQGLEVAVISGVGGARLIAATGGSNLSLHNISLVGGFASEQGGGGAIFANETTNIHLADCSFKDNNADRHGGECECLLGGNSLILSGAGAPYLHSVGSSIGDDAAGTQLNRPYFLSS